MIQFKNSDITVFESSLYKTTSAIFETSDAVIMTDPNWLPAEVEEINAYVNRIKGDKQLYIIYTHSDFDHIIGAGAFPEAKVIASQEFVDNVHKEDILNMVKQFDERYYLTRNYETIYPTVDIVISEDGQKVELDLVTITFYKAPGHTNDGLFTVIEPYGLFLAGDYLSDIEIPFIFSSYKDYVDTITKAEEILSKHTITTLVPGHGTTTQNVEEIQRRVNSAKYYLNQLLEEPEEFESSLSREYPFFEGMKGNHSSNLEIARKELM